MKVALLGTGRIGVRHAALLARDERIDLYVADAMPERAQAVATELGVQHLAVDDAFDPAQVDAVVIATGTDTHADLILRAVAAGLPFFCEKPVALDLGQTEAVVAAVDAAGVKHMIGFDRRFDEAYTTAREWVRSGELGEVHRIHMLTCDQNPPPEEFVAGSGGILVDCLIHDFDIVRWVTGREVVEVFAMGANRGADYFARYGDVSECVLTMRMDDDTLVTAHTSRYNGAGYDVRMELAGTRGQATVGLEDKVPLRSAEPGVTWPPGPAWVDFLARFEPCFERELRAFVDMLLGLADSPCTVHDGLAALKIALAAGRSLQLGTPVRLDVQMPPAGSAPDDDEVTHGRDA